MWCARDMMRWLVALGVGAGGFGLGFASAARADCGNVTATGICFDAKTVLYCDNGTLQTIVCATGETCDLSASFNGAAACVATRYSGCGDVPEYGQCKGQTLQYCEGSRVKERVCPDGTSCAWVEQEKWYDCIGVSGITAPQTDATSDATSSPAVDAGTSATEADASSSAPDDAATDTGPSDERVGESTHAMQNDTDATPATPNVQKGGAGAAAQYAAGGSGCAGGASEGVALAVVGALVGLSRRGARGRQRRSLL